MGLLMCDPLADMADHPYQTLPAHCFWRRSIGGVAAAEVDPVVRASFKINATDRVATAGSCFAQHIARHLVINGFNYYVAEIAHPEIVHLAGDYNYGVFSARYGNIYTSRQFLQTIQRAYGLLSPQDSAWETENGRCIDPYRPQIQPNGFASLAELAADRRQHLASVRIMIEQMNVLVFTLGLTETWVSRADGAAYPLCPGVAGGRFDETKHAFLNLSVDEVIADMSEAITLIRSKNRDVRFVLTVSPVPLIATMEDRSVLVSTTYSKSVLRVAAEVVSTRFKGVAYFPSYEVITGNYSRGSYYADDLREVTEQGVAHVMRLFMKHYAHGGSTAEDTPKAPFIPDARTLRAERTQRELLGVAAVICDEVALDPVTDPSPKPNFLELVAAKPVLPPVQTQPAEPREAITSLKLQPADPQPNLAEMKPEPLVADQPVSAMDYLRGAASKLPPRAVPQDPPAAPKQHGILRWFSRR